MMCQDLMKTDVQCVSPETTVRDAACRMRDEKIGFLPVCDASGKVLGTITDRDIAVRVVAEGEVTDQPVAGFVIQRVVSCRPTDDLIYAEELMSQEHVSRIMCTNERGELEGVLSLSDIAQVESGARAAVTLRNVSEREARA
jgi:CBS domain-containing protein